MENPIKIHIRQITFDPSSWNYKKWFVVVDVDEFTTMYLKNDGMLARDMQRTISDTKRGHYFNTFEEAEELVKKSFNATKNENDKGNAQTT